MTDRAHGHGRFAVGAAIFYIFLWAAAYVPSKIASTESPALWFLSARFLSAGVLLLLLAIALRRPFPATPQRWRDAVVLGLFGNALYLGLTYTALHRMSAGMGAIVASTNPLVLSLVAPFVLNEKLTKWKFAGLLLGFGGVVFMVVSRNGTPTALPFDVALAFGGVLASVTSTILFKRIAGDESLIMIAAIQMLAAGLLVIPAAWLRYGAPHVAAFTPELIGSFAFLVLVLSVGASLIWFWLLTNGEASVVSAYYYLTPVFGLALGALLLHERVGPSDLVGLVAIACGIAIVQRS